ncbi:MAG: hypothetical protein HUN05_17300 [Desulfobacter sp.]|nr:MAG: hypothetical protein HUN05_17300 [Desulfobacter sp.]
MGKKSRITPATRDCLNTLALRIKGAKQVVAFTGAGISTESGIPDYRSQGGLWDQFKPIFFDEFLSSKTARIKYWNQHLAMKKSLRHARPNKGHKALARVERRGFLSCIITQNIDGLHQASGIPPEKIIELHGNARKIACMSCAKQFTWGFCCKKYFQDKEIVQA